MYLVREIFNCKPGKVRPMGDKFTAMSKLGEKVGMPRMRIMTDLCGEHYWTVVAEMEVPSLGLRGNDEESSGVSCGYEKDGGTHEGLSRSCGSREAGDLQDRG